LLFEYDFFNWVPLRSLNTAARFLLPLVVVRFSTVAKDGFVDVLAAPGLVLLYLLGRKSAAALSASFLFRRIFVIFEICHRRVECHSLTHRQICGTTYIIWVSSKQANGREWPLDEHAQGGERSSVGV
jgi:hypothetical protein